jgi:hypothetical protein
LTVGREIILKMIIQLVRGKKTMMDPDRIKEAKKYGIEFETEPGKYTMETVKKIIITLEEV